MEIVAALVDEGFEVIEAAHAAEAISQLEAHGQDVRMLFTDVQMPDEMDGVRLCHHARRQWPRLGVIVTSGKAAPPSLELPRGSRFVPQPYHSAVVLAHVRKLVTE